MLSTQVEEAGSSLMATVYAIQDTTTGLYLAKDDKFRPLSTTTRTFQRFKQASSVMHNETTHMWAAVAELYSITGERVDISSKEFDNFVNNKKYTNVLKVVKVNLNEHTTINK